MGANLDGHLFPGVADGSEDGIELFASLVESLIGDEDPGRDVVEGGEVVRTVDADGRIDHGYQFGDYWEHRKFRVVRVEEKPIDEEPIERLRKWVDADGVFRAEYIQQPMTGEDVDG